jgi:hypothetical protein
MNFDFNTIKNAFRIKVKKILYIFVLFIAIIVDQKSYAQCGTCDVTIFNNGAGNDTPTSLADGQTICITAANRNRSINLRNRNNLTICVAPGANFSGALQNYNSNNRITINVFGTYEGGLTLNNLNSEFNVFAGGSYEDAGTLRVDRGSINNAGTIRRPIDIRNGSTYFNSGTSTGNITLRNNAVLTNEGTIDINNLTIQNNPTIFNRPTGIIDVNSTVTFRGTILNEGNIIIDGSANIQNGANFSVLNSGRFEVDDNINLRSGGTLVTSNPFNQSPVAIIIARDINLQNSGSGHSLSISENTLVDLSRDLIINGPYPVFVNGELSIGRNLNINNSGGGDPTRLTISGSGQVSVSRDVTSNRRIELNDNASLSVGRDLITTNNSSTANNNISLNDNSSLTVSRNTTINRPIIANGTSSVILNGDLDIRNVGGSGLNFNNSSFLSVGGETDVRGPIIFSDNSIADFLDDVNLFNVGSSRIELYDNADILITADLTAQSFGSTVIVRDNSQFVICDARGPSGSIEGAFPPSSRWGSTIDPSPAYYGGCRILPVEFLSFQSTYQVAKRTGLLEWSTAKEWESSHFEIERAVNSVDSWAKIGELQGKGFADTPTSYTFEDMNLPIQGGNIFYRLKQVDFDGTYTYSKTTAIQVEGLKGNKSWRVYPNPTSGYPFQIGLLDPSSYRDEPISLRIISPTGLYHFIQVNDLRSMGSQVGDWLSNQPSGLYTLEIIWGENREYHKVILRR